MKQQERKILITAALPYANGFIHLGHLAGAYLPADMYARYQRLKKREVLFLCGSDEHGVAITVSAEKRNMTPQEVVDFYHPENYQAFEKFEMSFDHYSRTSIPLHHQTAQEFFIALHQNDMLKEKMEEQLFCTKEGRFLPDRYVEGICPNCKYPQARGDQCENCGAWLNQIDLIEPKCKNCGSTPEIRETTHWYFPLGDYQERLVKYIQVRNQNDNWKENVLRYCENWFKEGLQDRAVTRDLPWGVKVPVKGYENKVIYVWFDAVLGYITSGKEWAIKKDNPNRWKEFWQDETTKYVAFIGKDNIVFHCIVFPAMLMAWNENKSPKYILPENVPANEFLNFEGQKFSKSRGWGIDVKDFLKMFPADALRYTLAVNLPETRDTDFYFKDFQARTNNELADILGNFVNRTLTFAQKNFGGKLPAAELYNESDRAFIRSLKTVPETVGELFEKYKFRDAVFEAMNLARISNKYFNDSEPWKTSKTNISQCATTINLCLQAVRTLAILFEPVVPKVSRTIWRMLNVNIEINKQGWDSAGELLLVNGHMLGEIEILISKIDDKAIQSAINSIKGEEKSVQVQKQIEPIKPQINSDDFSKIDLRLAEIVKAERIQKSEKLIKLQIKIGTIERQIVAGIGKHYTPESLEGKTIVVVANLQETMLMGQLSQGMLLAGSDVEGRLTLVIPESRLASGGRVK